jgi:S-adenosylmethionine:tRNA ribosyltransferase-isomerase
VELLLLHEKEVNLWECLVRPGRRLPPGAVIHFNGSGLTAEIVQREKNGSRTIKFLGVENIREHLNELGEIPFPPYVTQATCHPEAYQTVYAKHEGSVAAPTAGLHFTQELLQKLEASGIQLAEITLHVGWGTFKPVQTEDIAQHQMEKEWFSVSHESAEKIRETRKNGGRIVCVGTTSCRVLESFQEEEIKPKTDWTSLFIYPGFQFKFTDALITNFHLPKSTLLMLVSALAGRSLIFKAYDEAVRLRYCFYSFGDAMLIL